ncbi:hypothetical protein L1887_18515 [Cichorium endivia]|nr:hypothetical protein L1887_18515 [Cichorium endivia]
MVVAIASLNRKFQLFRCGRNQNGLNTTSQISPIEVTSWAAFHVVFPQRSSSSSSLITSAKTSPPPSNTSTDNSQTLAATVGVLCQLASTEPRSYLPLTPEFYEFNSL